MQKYIIAAGVIIVLFIICYGNSRIIQKGPTENLLLDTSNSLVQGERYLRQKLGGVPSEEFVIIQRVNAENAEWHVVLQEQIAALRAFPCLGFTNIPAVRDTYDPANPDDFGLIHIDPLLGYDGSLPKNWQIIAQKDETLRHFTFQDDASTYVITSCFLSHKKSGLEAAEELVGTVQGAYSMPWSLRSKFDVIAQWPGAMVAGWSVFRLVISKMLMASFANVLLLNCFILLPLFWCKFRSLVLACAGLGVIASALFITRGVMGILGIAETPFMLIPCVAITYTGQSALLRVFHGRDFHAGVWIVSLFGLIGFGLFLPPYIGFEVGPVRDLAYGAIFGICIVTYLATAVFSIVVEYAGAHEHKNSEDTFFGQSTKKAAQFLENYARMLSVGLRPWYVAGGVAGLFIFAFFLLQNGSISSASDPSAYMTGNNVVTAQNLLNDYGPGGTTLHYWVEPQEPLREGGRENPVFIGMTARWADQALALAGVYGVYSPVTGIHQSSHVLFNEPLPSIFPPPNGTLTRNKAGVIWNRVFSHLSSVSGELWSEDGVRVIFSTNAVTDTDINQIRQDIKKMIGDYPFLRITEFGLNAAFGESSTYVTQGKIRNTLTTPPILVVFVAVLLFCIQYGKNITVPCWIGAFAATIPFLFSFSLFLVLLWMLGKPLDIISATVSSLSISACGDTAIHVLKMYTVTLRRWSKEEAWSRMFREEGPRIVTDLFFNGITFVALLAAFFPVVRELGITMLLVVIANLFGVLVLMPPILQIIGKSGQIELEIDEYKRAVS